MFGIVYAECPHLFATVPYFRVQIPEVPAASVAEVSVVAVHVVVQRKVGGSRVVGKLVALA